MPTPSPEPAPAEPTKPPPRPSRSAWDLLFVAGVLGTFALYAHSLAAGLPKLLRLLSSHPVPLADALWVLPLLALLSSVGATVSWLIRGATPLGRMIWGGLIAAALLSLPSYALAIVVRLGGLG